MERVEMLKLMGMTEAEATAKAAEEDRMRAVFAAATAVPKAARVKPRVRGRMRDSGHFETVVVDANGEKWARWYGPNCGL